MGPSGLGGCDRGETVTAALYDILAAIDRAMVRDDISSRERKFLEVARQFVAFVLRRREAGLSDKPTEGGRA